jgi:CheY-like chemotaxis protein
VFPQPPVEVLLVEDNEGDVNLVRQSLLECDRPVELTVARDGEQALLALLAFDTSPDLVILDLNIPKFSGLEVLERSQQLDTPVFSIPIQHRDNGP